MNLDPNFASNFKLQQISRVTKEKKNWSSKAELGP
jgi:hypothetical protein